MPRTLRLALRSLLALVLAIAAIPVVNLAGAWLSEHVFGLPPGGTLRLAVDLFWISIAGFTGAWLLVRTAAVAKTAHAWLLFAIYLAAGLYGAITMGGDFPRWFVIGFLGLLPLQAWLGWWLAWGRRGKMP
ncbi:MAG TPA: hypothetical protein PLF73_09525 [Luteimonas sp.]|nr:hypothetical protein [Luteimonas sp.]HRO27917.1 hypothetical protein [Luteimonas sp.]